MMNKLNSLPLLIAIALILFSLFNKSDGTVNKTNRNVNIYNEDLEISISPSPIYSVIPNSIYDGDTLRVSNGSEEFKIRFACVDAPELKQEGGIESRDYLRSLLKENNYKVGIQGIEQDRYGRIIALLWLGNKTIQEYQVQNGWVYPYPQYKSDCPIWEDIREKESIAIDTRVNLYANYSKSLKPWEWRKLNK